MMDKTRARAWAYRIAAETLRRMKHCVDSNTVQRVLYDVDRSGLAKTVSEPQMATDAVMMVPEVFECIAGDLIEEAEKRELWIKQALEANPPVRVVREGS